MTNYIKIGKIINTQGIKGEVKILPLTSNKNRYNDLEKFRIEGQDEVFFTENVWFKKEFVILKIKGYDNINDVMKFKNKYIVIDEKDAVELPDGSYFIFEIKGLNVYDIDSNYIGIVDEVLQPGANDVYVVKSKNKKVYVPAIKEVVKKIDIENRKMIIHPIKGMI